MTSPVVIDRLLEAVTVAALETGATEKELGIVLHPWLARRVAAAVEAIRPFPEGRRLVVEGLAPDWQPTTSTSTPTPTAEPMPPRGPTDGHAQ
jgi:hypothetical protein